jgi:alcohol dehydrogenase class IV
MIPTTSGTGSEVTNIAVLALEQTKDVIVHDYMLPDLALVDPELTLTVPPRVTAATGMDALTHAIEAYLSVFASPVTDALALHAVRLGGAWLKRAVSDGADLEAREAMCQSSFMAGLAFFNAGVGGVHALAYPLGGQFHLPHGEANAVLLPYVMNRIRPACQDRMSDLLLAIGGEGAANNAEEASQRFVSLLHELNRAIGIPATLQAYGIEASHLDTLVRDALEQKRLLARSPMPLTETDIFAIYEAALLGRG